MAYPHEQAAATTDAGKSVPIPPTDEQLARGLGNLDRCHKLAGELERRLFGDASSPATEPSMPDAVAWKANAIGNETDRLAERLMNVLNRL